MWTEVIFTRDDLAQLLAQALPLTILLGASEHSVSLTELGDVSLVAGSGLRVACKASIHWPVMGIDIPVEVSSVVFLLVPTIEVGEAGEAERLVFRSLLESADFAILPAIVGDRITSAINAKLGAKGAHVSWKFLETLTCSLRLPKAVDPLDAFSLRCVWGKVRITDEAMVFAASFQPQFIRR